MIVKGTAASVVSKGGNGVGFCVFLKVGGSLGVDVAIGREGRVRVAVGAAVDDGITVAVGAVVVAALVGIIGRLAHAVRNNRHNRTTNRIKHRFIVFMLPVYNRSNLAFARLAYAYTLLP